MKLLLRSVHRVLLSCLLLVPMLALVLVLGLSAVPAAGASDFERYHPDQRFRRLGVEALDRQDHDWALRYLRKAARYADKPSQALIAELYWEGIGVPRDRARAYAWMDLAAERQYKLFLIKRERYWAELDAAERARALEVGAALYAEYEDAVAKPRLESLLRKGRKKATGSRLGFTAFTRAYSIGPDGILRWEPDYYAARHWQPEAYWRDQDRIWRNPVRGHVTVEPIRPDFGVPEREPPLLQPAAGDD